MGKRGKILIAVLPILSAFALFSIGYAAWSVPNSFGDEKSIDGSLEGDSYSIHENPHPCFVVESITSRQLKEPGYVLDSTTYTDSDTILINAKVVKANCEMAGIVSDGQVHASFELSISGVTSLDFASKMNTAYARYNISDSSYATASTKIDPSPVGLDNSVTFSMDVPVTSAYTYLSFRFQFDFASLAWPSGNGTDTKSSFETSVYPLVKDAVFSFEGTLS